MNPMVDEKNKFYLILYLSLLLVLGCWQNHPKKEPAQFKEYIDQVPPNEVIVNELKIKTSF